MVLRWGFLGSGKIARDLACSMLAVDGCEIVSVVRAWLVPARLSPLALLALRC